MGTNVWRGDAAAVAQEDDFTPGGTPIPGDLFKVTINGKTVSYTDVSTSLTVALMVSDVCTGLAAALSASQFGEFAELSYDGSSGTTVKGVAQTAGIPFVTSVSLTKANLAVPVLNAPTLAAGGTLVSGTPYYYVLTATNSNGETTISAQVTATPSGGNLSVVNTWTQVPGATGYKLYRSTTSGVYGASSLLTTIGAGTTLTYTDTGSATGAGTPPGANGALSTATFTKSTVTTSSGPFDAAVTANWTLAALPVNSDDVVFTNSASHCRYNLDVLAAVLAANLYVDSTFTGDLGLPTYNATGGYYEYRQNYLQLKATVATIGQGQGSGSGLVKLDLGSAQTAVTVLATGAPSQPGYPTVWLKMTHASNVLTVRQGQVGVAVEENTVSTILTLNLGSQGNPATDATVTLGVGTVTGPTTANQYGGVLTLQSSVTTHTMYGGTATFLGTATLGTLKLFKGATSGATFTYNSSGTLTTVTVGPGCTLDYSQDPRSKVITNAVKLYAGGTFLDPNKVTGSVAVNYIGCGLGDAAVDLGSDFTVTRS
jgi:hypothetical protein